MKKKRFHVLRVAGIVIALLVSSTSLVGCRNGDTKGDSAKGSSAEDSSAEGTGTDSGEAENTEDSGYADKIYIYNWSEYMTQDVKDAFYDEYGIEVVEATFESNEEMLAKLITGGSDQYDLAVPTNFFVEAMLANDLLEPYDEGAITNIGNIDEKYLNPDYDPEQKYTIPYFGTASLFVGNTKKLEELGVTGLNTYEDLLNPALENNLIIMDDNSGISGFSLQTMGMDPEVKTEETMAKAQENLLENINPLIKTWADNAGGRDMLIRGEAAGGYVYSGIAAQILAENPDTQLYLVDQHNSLSMDCLVLLKGSEHKKEAQLFVDFLLRPEISAQLTDAFMYVCPNAAAKEYTSEEVRNNPACFLPDEFYSDYYFVKTIPDDVAAMNDEVSTIVKSSK